MAKEKNENKININEVMLMQQKMLQADQNFIHKPYHREKSPYQYVASGDIAALEDRNPSLIRKGLGILSDDPLRNILFHMIINTTNCARICVDHGMDLDTSYTLSDMYIRAADRAKTIEEIELLNYKMMFDYTERMRNLTTKYEVYPTVLQRAINYIIANLHRDIYINDVAEHVGVSASTLSSKFQEYLQLNFNSYITRKRVQLAKQYLANTTLPINTIATNLSFCSQSYFSTIFKKETGMTPLKYRNEHRNDKISPAG